jgi:hypothetical protein
MSNDLQMLNASVLSLKASVDELIQVLRPSLKLTPDTTGAVGAFDPERAAGADALRAALRDSGLGVEQIENLVQTYILGSETEQALNFLP